MNLKNANLDAVKYDNQCQNNLLLYKSEKWTNLDAVMTISLVMLQIKNLVTMCFIRQKAGQV